MRLVVPTQIVSEGIAKKEEPVWIAHRAHDMSPAPELSIWLKPRQVSAGPTRRVRHRISIGTKEALPYRFIEGTRRGLLSAPCCEMYASLYRDVQNAPRVQDHAPGRARSLGRCSM